MSLKDKLNPKNWSKESKLIAKTVLITALVTGSAAYLIGRSDQKRADYNCLIDQGYDMFKTPDEKIVRSTPVITSITDALHPYSWQ